MESTARHVMEFDREHGLNKALRVLPTSLPKVYRQIAYECRRIAALEQDPAARTALFDLAAQWDDIAAFRAAIDG